MQKIKFILFLVAIWVAFFGKGAIAAEEAVGVIREDCTGHLNCYNSLASWLDNYGGIDFGSCDDRDLVCADKIAVAKIEGRWTNPDSQPVSLSHHWKTDREHYIKIYTTEEARHSGKWDENGYRLAFDDAFRIYVPFVRIEGLQINTSDSAIYNIAASYFPDIEGEFEFSHNIVRGDEETIGYGVYMYTFQGTAKIWNNIIYGVAQEGSNAAIGIRTGKAYIYNNTIGGTGSGKGISSAVDTTVVKNNLVNSAGVCFSGSFNYESDYNSCSNDSNTGGSHNLVNQTFQFINSNEGDFHLLEADLGAKDKGVNLKYDSFLAIESDVDGQTRFGLWDIGADDFFEGVPADLNPPSIPEVNLMEALSGREIRIGWSAAIDDVSIGGYRIFRNGREIAETQELEYRDSNLSPETEYSYQVKAFDTSFNESNFSKPALVATTQLKDVEPPRFYVVRVKELTSNSAVISWITDESADSKVEYGLNASYDREIYDSEMKLFHQISLENLSPGQHHFRIIAKDASGNEKISGDFVFDNQDIGFSTFYVDQNHQLADDSNIGTEDFPWKTLQHAADVVNPGDTVIVKPGSYGRISINRGGELGKMITFKGSTPPDRSNVEAGAIYDPTNPEPIPANTENNAVTKGFYFRADNVRVENFEITYISHPGRSAINMNKNSGNEVFGNFIHDLNADPNEDRYNYHGIAEGGDGNWIKGNFLYRVQGTGLVVSGSNSVYENNEASHGIDTNTETGFHYEADVDAMRFFGSGQLIRNNYFHDYLHEEQAGEPHMDCFQTFSVNPETQYANHIILEGNYCHRFAQMLMSSSSGDFIHHINLRNNIFSHCDAYAIITSDIEYFSFTNNIVAFSKFGPLRVGENAPNLTVLNNIFYANGSGTGLSSISSQPGSIWDFNIYWEENLKSTKISGYDEHSLFDTDPLFINSGGNFHLSSNSPALDAGTRVPGYIIDKEEKARTLDSQWDIGAYEYIPDDAVVPVAPTGLMVLR